MSSNLNSSFTQTLIMNTYDQLLNFKRSKSLKKFRSSDFFAKIKSVTAFTAQKTTPKLSKSFAKDLKNSESQPTLSQKSRPKLEIRSLNETSEPSAKNISTPMSLIHSALRTTLSSSIKSELAPSNNPAFKKVSNSFIQFDMKTKNSNQSKPKVFDDENEEAKYGSYQKLIELYESEKIARQHFEDLIKSYNTDKEVLIKKVEILKNSMDWITNQDQDKSCEEELKKYKEKCKADMEKLMKHNQSLTEDLKQARVREDELKKQIGNCENCQKLETELKELRDQSQLRLVKLQSQLDSYKSLEVDKEQNEKSPKLFKSLFKLSENKRKLSQSTLNPIPEINEVRKLKKEFIHNSLTNLISDKSQNKKTNSNNSELTKQFNNLKQENSKLYQKLLGQADILFEKTQELVELKKHKAELYKELNQAKDQVSEFKETNKYVQYLLEKIKIIKLKILKLGENLKKNVNKGEYLDNPGDFQELIKLADELGIVNLDSLNKYSDTLDCKQDKNLIEIDNEFYD